MTNYKQEISDLISSILVRDPGFAVIALSIPTIYKSKLPAPALTDGKTINVGPDFFSDKFTKKNRAFVLVHEMLHVAFGHVPEMRKYSRIRDHAFLWNIACDAIINFSLEKLTFVSTPEGCVNLEDVLDKINERSSAKDKWSSRTLFKRLLEEAKKETENKPSKSKGGDDGDEDGDGDGGGDGQVKGGDIFKPGKGFNNSNDPNGIYRLISKLGYPVQLDMQGQEFGDTIPDEIKDFHNMPEDFQKEIWNNRLKQGTGSSNILRGMGIDIPLRPYDWRPIVRKWMSHFSAPKFTANWSKSHKNFSCSRPTSSKVPFMPSSRREKNLKDLCLVIDTSGSVGEEEIRGAISLAYSVQKSLKCKFRIISCDAEVKSDDMLKERDDLINKINKGVVSLKGGGGTSFIPPIELVEGANAPTVMFYITDGYGSFPDRAPSFPVIWLMTTDVIAPWGRTIPISPEGDVKAN